MIQSISIGAIILCMFFGKIYPRQTLIVAAACILLILLYPLLPDWDASIICR